MTCQTLRTFSRRWNPAIMLFLAFIFLSFNCCDLGTQETKTEKVLEFNSAAIDTARYDSITVWAAGPGSTDSTLLLTWSRGESFPATISLEGVSEPSFEMRFLGFRGDSLIAAGFYNIDQTTSNGHYGDLSKILIANLPITINFPDTIEYSPSAFTRIKAAVHQGGSILDNAGFSFLWRIEGDSVASGSDFMLTPPIRAGTYSITAIYLRNPALQASDTFTVVVKNQLPEVIFTDEHEVPLGDTLIFTNDTTLYCSFSSEPPAGTVIRFSEGRYLFPDSNSDILSSPFTVSETGILRAAAFNSSEWKPSQTAAVIVLIRNDPPRLAVTTPSAEPRFLSSVPSLAGTIVNDDSLVNLSAQLNGGSIPILHSGSSWSLDSVLAPLKWNHVVLTARDSLNGPVLLELDAFYFTSLAVPESLTVQEISIHGISLLWAAVPHATHYFIGRSRDGSEFFTLDSSQAANFHDSTVEQGHQYTYRILAGFIDTAFDTIITTQSGFSETAGATVPNVFSMTFGSGSSDTAWDMVLTPSETYMLTGCTDSASGDQDVFLMEVDKNGNQLGFHVFPKSRHQCGKRLISTPSGYAVAGYTETGKDLDAYLVLAGSNGEFLADRSFGGNSRDEARSLSATEDGGLILAGVTESFPEGKTNMYFIRTDAGGDSLWTATFQDPLYKQEAMDVLSLGNGQYAAAGARTNVILDSRKSAFLIWFDEQRNIQGRWNAVSPPDNSPARLIAAADGGFFMPGYSTEQMLLNKFINSVLPLWEAGSDTVETRAYGASEDSLGYTVAGVSLSETEENIALFRVSTGGAPQWYRQLEHPGRQQAFGILPASDGGYIICGITDENGPTRILFLKTDPMGFFE